MENSYGGGGGKKVPEAADLEEEEVWAMINTKELGSNSSSTNFEKGFSSSFAWRANAAPKSISRASGGGGRQESSTPRRAARHQSSAPVVIPGRSKNVRKKNEEEPWDDACDVQNDGGGGEYGGEEEGEMAPPHEYLARRLEKTRIASHSMCEGVGGTLKGRDLRKIRNSILSKTGFIE